MLASAAVVMDASRLDSCRERRDFDGNADWEKGVVGELKPADVLAPALGWLGKEVLSRGEDWSALPAMAGWFWAAERVM